MIKRIVIFLDRLHWLWLVLAAPFLMFPSSKRSLAMLVIPAIFLIRWLAYSLHLQDDDGIDHGKILTGQSIIPITPFNGALLLMSIMVLVSLWATFDVGYSLPKITGIMLGISVFMAVAREGVRPRGWILSLLVFLGIGLGIGILGVLGTNWFSFSKIAVLGPITARLPKLITGLQGAELGFHPNEVAGGLIWVLPVMMAVSVLILVKPPRSENPYPPKLNWTEKARNIGLIVISLGATIFIGMVFLLCQSRGGYIGLAITLIVLFPIGLTTKWRRIYLVFLALLVITTGTLIALQWDSVRTWISGSNLTSDPALSLNSLAGRIEVWSRAIYGIQDFPFTGMGMNAFRKVMPVLYPLFTISPNIDIGHAHNEFLQAALDLGIPGLIAFISLYISAFWMLTDIWKTSCQLSINNANWSRAARLFSLGMCGGLLAHMLYGMTDAVALGAKPGLLFWMLLGLISALHQQVRERINPAVGNNSEYIIRQLR